MTRTTITLTTTLALALGSLPGCAEDGSSRGQPVDNCPPPETLIITDDSEGAQQLGVDHYVATPGGPHTFSLEVVGVDGEILAHMDLVSDGFRGGRVTTRVTGDASVYELVLTPDAVFATVDGQPAGSWHGSPEEGLVQDGDLLPGSEHGIALTAVAASTGIGEYALLGLEWSSWKCIKLKAKALALATLCVAGAIATGFTCATALACIAAGAGTIVACINYKDAYDAACDCNCWPWSC